MGRKELVFVVAAIAVVSLWLARPGSEGAPSGPSEAAPGFYIETNGRPAQLDDLVVTARFKSPEPVSVGYADGKIASKLTLTIDRFTWTFSDHPSPKVEKTEDGSTSLRLFSLSIVGKEKLETEKEWTFALSELHCENREMLERLFAGCPVVIKVEAMIALDAPGVRYNRSSKTVSQTIKLKGLPQPDSPATLLHREEKRIQADVERYLEEAKESPSSYEPARK